MGPKDALEMKQCRQGAGLGGANVRSAGANLAGNAREPACERTASEAGRKDKQQPAGEGQATRRSVTIGRCFRLASNVTASSSRTPGLPLTSVCGLAHGDPRPPGRRGGLGPTGVVAALRPGPRTRSSKSAATPGTRIWPPSSRTIWPTSTAPSAPRWPDNEINRRLSARTFVWPDSNCSLFHWQYRAQQ